MELRLSIVVTPKDTQLVGDESLGLERELRVSATTLDCLSKELLRKDVIIAFKYLKNSYGNRNGVV